MGYSIFVPFENEQEKKKMLEFMKNHYRSLGELIKTIDIESFDTGDGFPITDDVSYGKDVEPFVLGFDYGAGTTDEEKGYFYALCYFMSLMNGKQKQFGEHKNKPYIIYDGVDEWVLFVNEERDKSLESISVNEFGYRELPMLIIMKERLKGKLKIFNKVNPFMDDLTKIDTVIHDELKRLQQLWQNEVH